MFIKGFHCISPQETCDGLFLEGSFIEHSDGALRALEPSYSGIIPPGLLRRMGKAVRMGIGAGLPLIEKFPNINGIIIGSANGGLEDCIKFLNQIVDYNEGVLTPTNFVNSTPNAIAGQLAMMGKKLGYNSTHTNGSLAFDNALVDAQFVLDSAAEGEELLIGAIEEISSYNYNIDVINGLYKKESLSNFDLLESTSEGSLCGEGATMFVVSNDKHDALAEIVDTFQVTLPEKSEINDLILSFLNKNGLQADDIDCFLAGNAGDIRHDHWYNDMRKQLFPSSEMTYYKHFCGDYRTSSGFATYLAIHILNGNRTIYELESLREVNTILIYNQFHGARHGFILLRKAV